MTSPDFVGENRLLDDLSDRCGVGERLARVVLGHVAECVESEYQLTHETVFSRPAPAPVAQPPGRAARSFAHGLNGAGA
ncbi:MAG: hypothetical protein QOE94_2023 [Mycobacterium sp.]|nr:hypothetical protein [Mycobacterium sp.]